jgi:hypothetical protein
MGELPVRGAGRPTGRATGTACGPCGRGQVEARVEALRRALVRARAKARYLQDRGRAAPLPPTAAARLVALRLEAVALRRELRRVICEEVPPDDDPSG